MRSRLVRALTVCALVSVLAVVISAAISIPTGSPYTQNLDGLGIPASTTTASTLPADFRADNPASVRTVGSFAAALTTTARAGGANLSTSAANGIYNFGAGTTALGGSDRAVGFLSSGTATASGNLYAQLANNTGAGLTGLTISYNVEKYRLGTNAAGFCVQLYYSTTGASGSWTSAGANFLTAFPGDPAAGGNAGFATVPGAVQAVTNQTLAVAIPDGSSFFLAWNYSVCSGSTTTNAQALAVDDISITGIGAGDDAPTVVTTSPANGATNVPVASNIVINFSESVAATAASFALECPAGSPRAFTVSASPAASFTLDPVSDLPAGTTCTVTVKGNQISDTDTADPPDAMAADYTFTFSTPAPDVPPTVTTTSPANGASGVALGSNVVINFSEAVSASSTAFNLECPTGTPQTFSQSVSPASSFTLTPGAPLPAATICTLTVSAGQIADLDGTADPMAADYAFSFTTANPPPPGAGNVVINEVDADTPGSDTAEFVELYDGGVGNTALDGLVVVFYNGTDDKVYAAFDLDGRSTNGNGYFTLGNPGVPGVDLTFDPGTTGLLQNGADAVALYVGNASDFPVGASVTTANLQDAIVYDTDDADDPQLLVLLNPDQPQVNENGGGSGTTQSSQRCPNGAGGARNTSTYAQATPTPGAANVCTPPPPPQTSPVVISQVYGGGGNANATYHNDFVELYNLSANPVSLDGWSLQYASASGSGWDANRQPLGGTIGAGQYYLVALGTGGGTTGPQLPVPPANVVGQLNMSGTAGKIALTDTFDALVGNCPVTNSTHVKDFVGYGGADCREGTATAPSPPNNTTSILRLSGGATDTNQNGNDFVLGSPNPRRTAPIVELGPNVLGTDPRSNGVNAPRDATILVTFTEPVDVVDPWFTLTCASSGTHASATFAVNNGGRDHYITPNDNFTAGEQCTVTILKDQIHDVDTDDSGPNTDTLPANYVWSFTVSSGTAPPFASSVHLTMGNPGHAIAASDDNFLMDKPEFTVSYNRSRGGPNWVSWHLSSEWIGSLTRVDTFRPDPAVPPDWYRVQSFDFSGSGFDRGHMTPNADRDKETSIPINQATFLMSNMLPQAPDNNQGPWAALEGYLRTLVDSGNEVYIVAGGAGTGGTGSNGGVTTTLAGGHVTVPSFTWKVALVLPAAGGDDVSRVSCSTRTIAVVMPNIQGIRDDPWENFLTTVDGVEALSGLDFFSNVPPAVQNCIEAGINGNNPKNNQTISFDPIAGHTFGDADFTVSPTASSGLPVGVIVVSGPATIAGGTVHLTGAGTVTLRASQPGDENYNPAPTVDRSFDVAKAAQTITFDALPDRTLGDAPFTVSGSGGASGNPVTFAATGACTASGTTITIAAAGTCTVTASQAGNANYDAAADVSRSFTVNKAGAAISVTGYTGAFDGAAHGATGTATGIHGEDLSALLHLGASFTNAPGGTAHWIFDGNASYAAASGDVQIVINTLTPAFSGLSAPSIQAGTVTTAIGGTLAAGAFVPGGSVTVTIGATNLAAAIGAGGQFSASFPTATLGPANSPDAIAFSYAGGTNFNAAAASSSLTVADTIPPVITLVGANPLTVQLGAAFTDPGATASDSFAGNLTGAIQVTGTVNTAVLGSYTRTYTVSDGYNTASVTRTVNVVDTTGPVITNLSATPNQLFFPTNTLWPVLINYNATDASGQAVCSLSVTNNDLDDRENRERGHGLRDIDWIVVTPHLVLLRAERAPRRSPQLIYTITVTCRDTSGNQSSAQVMVPVRKR